MQRKRLPRKNTHPRRITRDRTIRRLQTPPRARPRQPVLHLHRITCNPRTRPGTGRPIRKPSHHQDANQRSAANRRRPTCVLHADVFRHLHPSAVSTIFVNPLNKPPARSSTPSRRARPTSSFPSRSPGRPSTIEVISSHYGYLAPPAGRASRRVEVAASEDGRLRALGIPGIVPSGRLCLRTSYLRAGIGEIGAAPPFQGDAQPGDHRHGQQRHQRVHLRHPPRQLRPPLPKQAIVPALARPGRGTRRLTMPVSLFPIGGKRPASCEPSGQPGGDHGQRSPRQTGRHEHPQEPPRSGSLSSRVCGVTV
jgi:hypothetical protein